MASNTASGGGSATLASASNSFREVSPVALYFLQDELTHYLFNTRAEGSKIEFAFVLLEEIGYSLGLRLVERLVLTRPRIWDQRECVKFICKDIWTALFQKQADRLQTNRRGGYVILDNRLPPLATLPPGTSSASPSAGLTMGSMTGSFAMTMNQSFAGGVGPRNADALAQQLSGQKSGGVSANLSATQILLYHCGVIRGALTNLGFPCTVTAETNASPACTTASLAATFKLSF